MSDRFYDVIDVCIEKYNRVRIKVLSQSSKCIVIIKNNILRSLEVEKIGSYSIHDFSQQHISDVVDTINSIIYYLRRKCVLVISSEQFIRYELHKYITTCYRLEYIGFAIPEYDTATDSITDEERTIQEYFSSECDKKFMSHYPDTKSIYSGRDIFVEVLKIVEQH